MLTLTIDGKVIARERCNGADESAATMHDVLHALTFGDDVAAMRAQGYFAMAAAGVMVETGESSLYYFSDSVSRVITDAFLSGGAS